MSIDGLWFGLVSVIIRPSFLSRERRFFLLVFRASSRLGPDKHERRYTKRTKVMRECEIYTQAFPAQKKGQKKPRNFKNLNRPIHAVIPAEAGSSNVAVEWIPATRFRGHRLRGNDKL